MGMGVNLPVVLMVDFESRAGETAATGVVSCHQLLKPEALTRQELSQRFVQLSLLQSTMSLSTGWAVPYFVSTICHTWLLRARKAPAQERR